MDFFGKWKKARQSDLSLEQLTHEKTYPILNHRELIQLLGQENRVRNIRRLTSVDSNAYEKLYQSAIDNFIEACQLQPASTVHHHASLGGLIVHTLEVVEFALKQRKRYLLPQNAEPETITREEHVWTYAIFAAALLHDAGKLLTLTRLKLDNKTSWTPVGPALRDTEYNEYSIEFVNSNYDLQTSVSTMLFDLLPPLARDMLVQNQLVLKQLTSYLSNNNIYEGGIIRKIVSGADAESTSRNVSGGNTIETLKNIPSVSMADLLINALRQLIKEGELKFNSSGCPCWFDGKYAYVACKRAADEASKRVRSEGISGVPADPPDIFDMWQNAGYAIPKAHNRSVWKIQITGPDNSFQHVLTTLKFEADRLIHPSMKIPVFNGEIATFDAIVENNSDEALDQSTLSERQNKNSNNSKQNPIDTLSGATDEQRQADPTSKAKTTLNETTDTVAVTAELINQLTGKPNSQTSEEQAALDVDVVQSTTSDEFKNKLQEAQEGLNKSAAQVMNPKVYSGACSLEHDNIGRFFLTWLRDCVIENSLSVNEADSMVHIVDQGVAFVTPRIFNTFALKNSLVDNEEQDTLNSSRKRVQSRFFKLKAHIKTRKKYDIHKLSILNSDATLSAIIVKTQFVYPDATHKPDSNPSIEVRETFHA